jgi:hypothetical protein
MVMEIRSEICMFVTVQSDMWLPTSLRNVMPIFRDLQPEERQQVPPISC